MRQALAGLKVVELGDRIAAGACGRIFAALGADVRVRRSDPQAGLALPRSATKWAGPHFSTLDKRVLTEAEIASPLRCDLVIQSSDLAPPPTHVEANYVIDITAYGTPDGPRATEWMLQAETGVADTSGFADGAPTPTPVPLLEMAAASYAAVGALSGLLRDGGAQTSRRIDVSIYDCGINALATFLPKFLGVGATPKREGNAHPLAAPWNNYRTADGWVLVCSATDEQWARLCAAIGAPELASGLFAELQARITRRAAVDAVVEAWTSQRTTEACVEELSRSGIACGPIAPLDYLDQEPNVRFRQTLQVEKRDGVAVRHAPLPIGATATKVSGALPDAGDPPVDPRAPLARLRVVEIGHYTTAPLAARYLAMLGAEIVKLEPAGGEASRKWPPVQDGKGLFYMLSNAGKTSVEIDLRSEAGNEALTRLIQTSDVLVENMRPGALAKLGFSTDAIAELNPRLVYCPISGFGLETAYPERPAFDSVIQAMSGMMDATRSEGAPMKIGVSAADMAGGQLALIAILSALIERRRSGAGAVLDIAMQDAALWCLQSQFDGAAPEWTLVDCADGRVLAHGAAVAGSRTHAGQTRVEAVRRLRAHGVLCAPVLDVGEAASAERTRDRELIRRGADETGREWPLLAPPIEIDGVRLPVGAPILFRDAEFITARDARGRTAASAEPGAPKSTEGEEKMSSQFASEQVAIRCTLMRGGTSKGVYLHEQDIPPAGALRDKVLKRIMGTPDVMQIDGLGGTHLVTSKIAIVKRSSHPEADIDYTFAQAELDRDVIDYEGNCGNISAGVGPFAVDAGLVEIDEPVTQVRVYNTNTDKIFVANVPVIDGRAKIEGDTAIAGVPGTGAEIFMDYSNTIGAKTGRLLPTGNVTDALELENGDTLEATICDVANTCVFVRAADIGLVGDELPERINHDEKLVGFLREIRGKAAERIGYCSDWRKVDDESPFLPFVVFVSKPADYTAMNQQRIAADTMDLRSRLIFMNRCHESMAGTGSMCTAAASRVDGSIVNQALGAAPNGAETLRIGHPLGVMTVKVKSKPANFEGGIEFDGLGFVRTARRLMDGFVYVPASTFA